MTSLLLTIHFAATWYLVGLCWLVQRVQYPLMSTVGREAFVAYEAGHVSRIGPVVAPMMIVELATGLLLLAIGGQEFRRPTFLVALALLVALWLSTFLIQVPLHASLRAEFDVRAHAALVRTNWIRTIAWSLRGAILLWWLSSHGLETTS